MRTLVWDVDDVLSPLMAAWHASWREANPSAPPYAALTANPPHAVLGVDLATYHASLDAFRRDRYASLPPDPVALAFLASRGSRYRHVALTATPRFAVPIVAAWVLEHFGDWIRTVGFVPSPRPDRPLPAYDRSKGDWLRAHAVRDALLLDDTPANVAAATEAGVEAWVVGQPWNDAPPLAELLARL